MKKLILFTIIFVIGCEDSNNHNENHNSNLLFVSSEGTYGNGDGSISVFYDNEMIQTVEEVGDVVQSLIVNNDHLFVVINNSHKIKRYTITESGLNLPGIDIETSNSSPREMVVVDDKLYFTNWNSSDVKIFDMINYIIEDSIQLSGYPESIIYGDESLWVGIQLNDDYSDSNKLHKIDPISKTINQTYEIGYGPTDIEINGESIYVANTYYGLQVQKELRGLNPDASQPNQFIRSDLGSS